MTGCRPRDNGTIRSSGVPMLHLSRLCLVTTRTTTGLGGGSGTIGCLSTVIDHTGPRGAIRNGAIALSSILLRHHGRLFNRKRHFFSTLHGRRAVIHGRSAGRFPRVTRASRLGVISRDMSFS